MSVIQSTTSSLASPYATTVAATSRPLGRFETNEKDVGPVAASVIGAADVARDGVSATVSLSARALGALEDAGKSATSSVEDAAHDIAQAATSACDAVKSGISGAVGGAENLASEGWQKLEDGADKVVAFAHDVGDIASAAATKLGDAASAVLDGAESAAGTVATYVALGYKAGEQVLDAFA